MIEGAVVIRLLHIWYLLSVLLVGTVLTGTDAIEASAAPVVATFEKGFGSEEIVIKLPVGFTSKSVAAERTGRTSFTFRLPTGAELERLPMLETHDLVAGVGQQDSTITITLSTPAFGYIITRPSVSEIRASFFPDAVGESWKAPAQAVTPAPTVKKALPSQTLPQVVEDSQPEHRLNAPAEKALPNKQTMSEPDSDASSSASAESAAPAKMAEPSAHHSPEKGINAAQTSPQIPLVGSEQQPALKQPGVTTSKAPLQRPDYEPFAPQDAVPALSGQVPAEDTGASLRQPAKVDPLEAHPAVKPEPPQSQGTAEEVTLQGGMASDIPSSAPAEGATASVTGENVPSLLEGTSAQAEEPSTSSSRQILSPVRILPDNDEPYPAKSGELAPLPPGLGNPSQADSLSPLWRPTTPSDQWFSPLPPVQGLQHKRRQSSLTPGDNAIPPFPTLKAPLPDESESATDAPAQGGKAHSAFYFTLPLGALVANAAESDDASRATVEAPFEMEAFINRGGPEQWVEKRIPVLLNAPREYVDDQLLREAERTAQERVLAEHSSLPGIPANGQTPAAPAGGTPQEADKRQSPSQLSAPGPAEQASGLPFQQQAMPDEHEVALKPAAKGAASQSTEPGAAPVPQSSKPAVAPPASAESSLNMAPQETAGKQSSGTPDRTAQQTQPTAAQEPQAAGQLVQPGHSVKAGQDKSSTQEKQADPETQKLPSAPATKEEGVKQPEETVIYVDEQGKPIDPPLDAGQTLKDIEKKIGDMAFQEAYDLADNMLKQQPFPDARFNLTNAQREAVLHRKADALYLLHRDNPMEAFQAITEATQTAINFNTASPRNADAYLRLGYLNLQADNAYEAAADFNVLRSQFPTSEAVPLSYNYWGDYLYKKGNLNEAVDQFQYVLNQFPDSRYARDAALSLTRTLYHLGYYSQASKVIDYVSQRWPAFYLDYPAVLSMRGDVTYREGNLDQAKTSYWLYYNLNPNVPDADIILTRLGDIYSAEKYHNAAIQVYEEASQRFPGKDGGIIALMRLAEDGIHDDPNVIDMFKVFGASNLQPADAYRRIIREYPDSPLAPLARLKLAMWKLWQKDYDGALELCSIVVSEHPDGPLTDRAKEVAVLTFSRLAADSVNDKRYQRLREAWQKYPILQSQEEILDPESRLALAVSQWEAGRNQQALDTIEPFFLGSKIPQYSELALVLGLNIMVEYGDWNKIQDLAQRVEMWELTPPTRRQLDYAVALAYENEDNSKAALPYWRRLYDEKALPASQMAYTAFFLAREEQQERQVASAYQVGQDALRMFKDLAAADPAHADTEKIKSQLSSLLNMAEETGLLNDALSYAREYLSYVQEGSSDYLSILYRSAQLNQKLGNDDAAHAIAQELSAKYPDSYYGKMAASQLRSGKMEEDIAKYGVEGGL